MIGLHTAHRHVRGSLASKETNAGATWLDAAFVGVALSIWFGWLLWVTRTRLPETLVTKTTPSRQDTGMSESTASSNSCPKCGAALPSAANSRPVPRCLMAEAMVATQVDVDPAAARQTLAPEELAPFFRSLKSSNVSDVVGWGWFTRRGKKP